MKILKLSVFVLAVIFASIKNNHVSAKEIVLDKNVKSRPLHNYGALTFNKFEEGEAEKKNNIEKRIAKMKKDLLLTDAQTESIRVFLNEHLEKMRQLKEQRKTDGENNKLIKERIKEEENLLRTKINSILTPEQQQKMDSKGNKYKTGNKGKQKSKARKNKSNK